MKQAHDSQKQKENTFIRDHLAAHRTDLANERTFLAYIRAALTFFCRRGNLHKVFWPGSNRNHWMGLHSDRNLFFIKGLIGYKKIKRVIREEERNPPKVSDI